MRRDIGNEIIVAIAAIGMLAIAIAFAIILSLSRNAEDNLTPTAPIDDSTEQALVSSAPQNSDTATPIVVTATFTALPSTDTNTPQPSTQAPKPTTAPTETAQDTIKPKPTHAPPESTSTTNTSEIPASATPRATTAVPTQQPSDTSVPTKAASQTPIPSSTPTLVPTTAVPTLTPTVKPSATPIPPSHTPRPTATFTPTAVRPTKPPPPPTKVVPPPSPQMAVTVTGANGVLMAEGCTDSGVQISNITPGQVVKGVITLVGTAYNQNLLYYKLETRPDFSQFYTLYNRYETVVIQNELGTIDTSIFSPGLYWIQLTVVNKDQTISTPCAIPVMIQR